MATILFKVFDGLAALIRQGKTLRVLGSSSAACE